MNNRLEEIIIGLLSNYYSQTSINGKRQVRVRAKQAILKLIRQEIVPPVLIEDDGDWNDCRQQMLDNLKKLETR